MVKDGILRASPGMVADKDEPVDPLVDTLHHRQWGIVSADQLGARVKVLEQNIGTAVVPIGDQDILDPGYIYTSDGRVDVIGHQATETRVLGVVGVNLVPVGHTGDAFHIGSNEDFHGSKLLGYFLR